MKTFLYVFILLNVQVASSQILDEFVIGKYFKMHTIAINTNDDIFVSGVTSENHVLTKSYHTFIIKSTDKGDTWNYILRKDFDLFDASNWEQRYMFLYLFSKGNDTVFAFCDGGIVFKSYDAGISWDSTRITYRNKDGELIHINNQAWLKSIDNYNFKSWIAKYPDLPKAHYLYSTDTGETWHEQNILADSIHFQYGQYLLSTYSHANDSIAYFTFLHRINAYTYLYKFNNRANQTEFVNQLPENFLSEIIFWDEKKGFALGNTIADTINMFPGYDAIYETNDGGETFSKFFYEKCDSLYPYRMVYQDDKYFIGGYRGIAVSENNGLSWNYFNIKNSYYMTTMKLTSDNTIFITDDDNYGRIFRVRDFPSSVDNSVNINQNISKQITNSKLIVSLTKQGKYNYQIYDLLGKKVAEGTHAIYSDFNTLDISNLFNGQYVIVFTDSNSKYVSEMVFIKD